MLPLLHMSSCAQITVLLPTFTLTGVDPLWLLHWPDNVVCCTLSTFCTRCTVLCVLQEYLSDSVCNLSTEEAVQVSCPSVQGDVARLGLRPT